MGAGEGPGSGLLFVVGTWGLVRGLARAFRSWLEEEVMGVTVSVGCEPLGWAVLLGWSQERPEDVLFFFFFFF